MAIGSVAAGALADASRERARVVQGVLAAGLASALAAALAHRGDTALLLLCAGAAGLLCGGAHVVIIFVAERSRASRRALLCGAFPLAVLPVSLTMEVVLMLPPAVSLVGAVALLGIASTAMLAARRAPGEIDRSGGSSLETSRSMHAVTPPLPENLGDLAPRRRLMRGGSEDDPAAGDAQLLLLRAGIAPVISREERMDLTNASGRAGNFSLEDSSNGARPMHSGQNNEAAAATTLSSEASSAATGIGGFSGGNGPASDDHSRMPRFFTSLPTMSEAAMSELRRRCAPLSFDNSSSPSSGAARAVATPRILTAAVLAVGMLAGARTAAALAFYVSTAEPPLTSAAACAWRFAGDAPPLPPPPLPPPSSSSLGLHLVVADALAVAAAASLAGPGRLRAATGFGMAAAVGLVAAAFALPRHVRTDVLALLSGAEAALATERAAVELFVRFSLTAGLQTTLLFILEFAPAASRGLSLGSAVAVLRLAALASVAVVPFADVGRPGWIASDGSSAAAAAARELAAMPHLQWGDYSLQAVAGVRGLLGLLRRAFGGGILATGGAAAYADEAAVAAALVLIAAAAAAAAAAATVARLTAAETSGVRLRAVASDPLCGTGGADEPGDDASAALRVLRRCCCPCVCPRRARRQFRLPAGLLASGGAAAASADVALALLTAAASRNRAGYQRVAADAAGEGESSTTTSDSTSSKEVVAALAPATGSLDDDWGEPGDKYSYAAVVPVDTAVPVSSTGVAVTAAPSPPSARPTAAGDDVEAALSVAAAAASEWADGSPATARTAGDVRAVAAETDALASAWSALRSGVAAGGADAPDVVDLAARVSATLSAARAAARRAVASSNALVASAQRRAREKGGRSRPGDETDDEEEDEEEAVNVAIAARLVVDAEALCARLHILKNDVQEARIAARILHKDLPRAARP